MASRRTEMPRLLMSGGVPERRGSVSTRPGVIGLNLTVSPSVRGPAAECQGSG